MTITSSNLTHLDKPGGTLAIGYEKKSSAFERAWMRGEDIFSSGGSASALASPLDSEWIIACLRLLIGPLEAVGLGWYADARFTEPLAPVPDRDAFWSRPCADDYGTAPIESAQFLLATLLALEGEAYIVLEDEWLAPRLPRNPAPFIVAGRHELTPQFGQARGDLRRSLLGYLYSAAGTSALLAPEQVIRLEIPNAYSRDRGLSAWRAAKTAADADHAAAKYAGTVAASNGQQPDYITTDGGMPSPEQVEQIISQLRAKRERVARGDFSPVFLAGGLKVQSPTERAVTAALLAARAGNRESIAAALGVPLSMLQQVTGSSLGEGRVDSEARQLIANGTTPLARRIAAAFAEVERRRARSYAVFARYELDNHPANRSARLAQATTAQTLVAMGFTLESVNTALALGLELPAPAEPAPPAPPEPDKLDAAVNRAKKAIAHLIQTKALTAAKAEEPAAPPPAAGVLNTPHAPAGPTPSTPSTESTPSTKPRDKKRLALWERYQRTRKKYEQRIFRETTALYRTTLTAALKKLASELPTENPVDAALPAKTLRALETKAAGAGVGFALFDATALADQLADALLPIIADAYAAGTTEAGGGKPPTEEIQAYLKARENLIRDTADETFASVQGSLNAGWEAGETMPQLAGRVKAAMHAEDARATTIATTETHTAFNVARERQHESAGVEYREWLTAGDGRVRSDHEEADGQVQPAGVAFVIGRARLMHPCEAGGPPDQVINCRCIAIALTGEEGERRYKAQEGLQ